MHAAKCRDLSGFVGFREIWKNSGEEGSQVRAGWARLGGRAHTGGTPVLRPEKSPRKESVGFRATAIHLPKIGLDSAPSSVLRYLKRTGDCMDGAGGESREKLEFVWGG